MLNNFGMFIEFRTAKYFVSKGNILKTSCYEFIQVNACKKLTY